MAKESWITKLFKTKTKQQTFNEALSFRGYEPSFTSFGSSILYSDLIQSALRMKARFFGKLEPRHIRNDNGKIITINDSAVAKMLKSPNFFQTTYDFLTQAYFMREKDDNCYIYIDYYVSNAGQRVYTDMFILLPSEKPKILDDGSGNLKIAFRIDGYSSEIIFDYNEIVIWKHNYEDNQFMGGGKFGSNANADLKNSLDTYHSFKETTAEASKISCMFDGILKVNAFAQDDETIKAVREKFLKDLRENKTGVAVLDNGTDYQAVQRSLKMVDSATMKEVKDNILIHTGVSLDMLQGKFTNADKEAFYENFIEPSAISLGQALSKVIFSQWQTSHGDEIVLYPHKVQLMATSEIVSVIQSTISAGVFTINEYRSMLGYAPLDGEVGEQRPRGFNNLDGAKGVDTQQKEQEVNGGSEK